MAGKVLQSKAKEALKTLYIVHDLDAKELKNTLEFLKKKLFYQDINLIKLKELKELQNYEDLEILTLHLSLDKEIETHQKISNFAKEQGIAELNPYNDYIDDKFSFYNLMLANDFEQPKTFLIEIQKSLEGIKEEIKTKKLIIKPRHGTENLDVKAFSAYDTELENHIQKIHKYDDALVQDYQVFEKEIRIVVIDGKIFSKSSLNNELKALAKEVLEVINLKADQKTRILALDILKTKNSYMVLEANQRPAGIFKLVN